MSGGGTAGASGPSLLQSRAEGQAPGPRREETPPERPAQCRSLGLAVDLMPENVVEEKTKELDLNMVMAEIRREGQPSVQWR